MLFPIFLKAQTNIIPPRRISIEILFIVISQQRYNVNMVEISFSKNLRQLMKDNNINQVILSSEIGVAQSAVSAWLSDKKDPNITSLWLFADYFDCSIDELVGRKI